MTENSRHTEQEEGEGHTDIVRLFITDLKRLYVDQMLQASMAIAAPLHYAVVGGHLLVHTAADSSALLKLVYTTC